MTVDRTLSRYPVLRRNVEMSSVLSSEAGSASILNCNLQGTKCCSLDLLFLQESDSHTSDGRGCGRPSKVNFKSPSCVLDGRIVTARDAE